MKTKRVQKQKLSKFNYELNKLFHKDMFLIQDDDIDKSIHAIYCISEYIRYSYFDTFYNHTPDKIRKYCRLLLHYERCTKSKLINLCKLQTKKLIQSALKHPSSIKSIDLALSLSESQHPSIKDLANQLMIEALGTTVRGINE